MSAPTAEQQRILDWVANREAQPRHAMVNAKAGTGKSHTLLAASELIVGRSVFLAFNKSIATELDEKLREKQNRSRQESPRRPDTDLLRPPMRAMTIHSLGYNVLRAMLGNERGFFVDFGKYSRLSRAALKKLGVSETEAPAYRKAFKPRHHPKVPTLSYVTKRLVDISLARRSDVADNVALHETMLRYELHASKEHRKTIVQAAKDAILLGKEMVLREDLTTPEALRVVAPADMLVVPLQLSELGIVWPDAFTYDWIFVDEAQDLSAAQRDVVIQSCETNGRMLFVGDPAQAINGFAGASSRSFREIQDAIGATEFMLTGCFRCPELHLEHARYIVPEINSRVTIDANYLDRYGKEPECGSLGQVSEILSKISESTDDDVSCVISRGGRALEEFKEAVDSFNSDAIKLQRPIIEIESEPKSVEELNELAESILDSVAVANPSELPSESAINEAHRLFVAELQKLPSDEKPGSKTLKNALQLALGTLEDPRPRSWSECKARLWQTGPNKLAKAPNQAKRVRVLTAHKSKGLEASRIFILSASTLAPPAPQNLSKRALEELGISEFDIPLLQESMLDNYQQEWHLLYVALTRSKNGLYWCDGDPAKRAREIDMSIRDRIRGNHFASSPSSEVAHSQGVLAAESRGLEDPSSGATNDQRSEVQTLKVRDIAPLGSAVADETVADTVLAQVRSIEDSLKEIRGTVALLSAEVDALKVSPSQSPTAEDLVVYSHIRAEVASVQSSLRQVLPHLLRHLDARLAPEEFIGATEWEAEHRKGLSLLADGVVLDSILATERVNSCRIQLSTWLVYLLEILPWEERALGHLDSTERFARLKAISDIRRMVDPLRSALGLHRVSEVNDGVKSTAAWNLSGLSASDISPQTSLEIISNTWILGTRFIRRGFAVVSSGS